MQNSQRNTCASACNFINKETLAQVLPREFCTIFKSTVFTKVQNTSGRLVLFYSILEMKHKWWYWSQYYQPVIAVTSEANTVNRYRLLVSRHGVFRVAKTPQMITKVIVKHIMTYICSKAKITSHTEMK